MGLLDYQNILPGINGEVNIRKLDTPGFGLLKRVYDQAQTYGRERANARLIKTTREQRFAVSNKPGEIQEFMSLVRADGVAKPNQFKAMILLPPALSDYDLARKTSLLCEVAQIPSLNIMTHQVRTHGPFFEIPYMRVNEPLTMTFIADGKLRPRVFFDTWVDKIVDPKTNDVGLYENFVGSIILLQVSPEDASTVYAVTLQAAYPKVVHEMQLNQGSQNEAHRVTVQFVYEKMMVAAVDIPTPNTSNSPLAQMRKVSGLDKIKGGLNNVQSMVTDVGSNLMDGAKNMYSQAGETVTGYASSATSKLKDISTTSIFG